VADSTSKRLAQPRVRIMPTPKHSPPTSAPDRLPVLAICREPDTSSQPLRVSHCTATTADANVISHTGSFSPNWPCQNSTTAARRQNRERWAKKPNNRPSSAPPKASTAPSPYCSSKEVRSSMGSTFGEWGGGAGRPKAITAH